MLTNVRLRSTDGQVAPADYRLHIRQEANTRWLSVAKVPLGIYCMSGTNPRNPLNRLMHRIGEAPVAYNDTLMRYSQASLKNALRTKGYLHAQVDTLVQTEGRRTRLQYTMRPGRRTYVQELSQVFDNDSIAQIVHADSAASLLYRGMPLDFATLDAERSRMVELLQNSGYININNEFIEYTADTIAHSTAVRLTLHFRLPPRADRALAYQPYRIGKVNIFETTGDVEPSDSSHYRNTHFYNEGRQRINRLVYVSNNFILADSLYSERATRYTYQNLNALSAVNYSTIRYSNPEPGDSTIDANIMVHLNKPHGVSLDLEGTNTAGDFGGAATFTYTHRNLFRGAQALSLKLRGAYEAIRRLEGYSNQNYLEYGAEATLRFPNIPFFSLENGLRRYKGATDLSLVFNSQNRPEFNRRLLTATLSFKWSRHNRPNWRNQLDLISLNYVYMPWISDTFRRDYLEGDDARYAVLRYSYENLFIMRSSYGFVYNSLTGPQAGNLYQKSGYQIRMNIETAGNILYGLSHLAGMSRNSQGSFTIGNIPYSQYVKFDADYSRSLRLDERSSLAFHAAFGIAIPYGNSSIIPYEKRYFAGGANSVRGWSVRTLGPGAYVGKDGNIDFINQTGNLKLDLSMEYRAALFWKFEGAAFIDAGNVWNLSNYSELPGGQFTLKSLYQQMAVAYGLGLRLNLNYFILRFDGGMKAINPAVPSGKGHFPIISPNFGRDFALHFAVGLPF
ncbi:MAG: BamA/TamA family outer membrane protein [Bacteroidaceae bacterium]|nr:BamA/TamA family outer membrane protein [Bacteroidaceae bacterium]